MKHENVTAWRLRWNSCAPSAANNSVLVGGAARPGNLLPGLALSLGPALCHWCAILVNFVRFETRAAAKTMTVVAEGLPPNRAVDRATTMNTRSFALDATTLALLAAVALIGCTSEPNPSQSGNYCIET